MNFSCQLSRQTCFWRRRIAKSLFQWIIFAQLLNSNSTFLYLFKILIDLLQRIIGMKKSRCKSLLKWLSSSKWILSFSTWCQTYRKECLLIMFLKVIFNFRLCLTVCLSSKMFKILLSNISDKCRRNFKRLKSRWRSRKSLRLALRKKMNVDDIYWREYKILIKFKLNELCGCHRWWTKW